MRDLDDPHATIDTQYADLDVEARARQAAEAALERGRTMLTEHLDAVRELGAMPPVGDHGDTRWGEGYKRACEQSVNALSDILAALDVVDVPTAAPA